MKKGYKLSLVFILMFLLSVEVKAATAEENINSLITRLDTYNTKAFIKAYPVGSIYITTSSAENTAAKVAAKYGGTWEAFGTNRTLRGTTVTAGSTGGTDNVTLTSSYMPAHTHTIPALSGSTESQGSGYSVTYATASRTTSTPTANETITANYNGYQKTETTASGYVYYMKASTGGANTDIASSVLTLSSNHTHKAKDYYYTTISGVEAHKHSFTTAAKTSGSTGSGTAFSVLDPYITVYMYKRTA